jgi:spore coat protein CotH
MWGRGGWLFILALCGLLGTSSVMTYRVNAGEEQNAITQQNIKILGENQQQMDEESRITAQQVELANKQLRLLLQLEGVTERVEPPKVKKTQLKELE